MNCIACPVATDRFFYRHVGLLIWRPGMIAPLVFSTTPSEGPALVLIEEFAQGRAVYRIDNEPGWMPALAPSETFARLRAYRRRPYRLLSDNCEHVVKSLIGRSIESPQLQQFAVATLVALTIRQLWPATSVAGD